jgi:hypothetical protein
LNEHLEGLAGRFKAQEMADKQQMTGRGDRNKFGQAFDQAEHNHLPECHPLLPYTMPAAPRFALVLLQ